MRQVLHHGGNVQLTSTEDGRTGLARAKEMMPDLILLDFRLPDMTGLDVLLHLRTNARTREIPVVMVSAEAHGDIIASCLASGAMEYLTKPFDLHQLLHVVARAAGGLRTGRAVSSTL